MLDIYTDVTLQCATFGGHMEIIEVEELAALRRDVSADAIRKRVTLFREKFAVQANCSEPELERAARASVALDRLVELHDLGSMAYYHMGTGSVENEDTLMAPLTTARSGWATSATRSKNSVNSSAWKPCAWDKALAVHYPKHSSYP